MGGWKNAWTVRTHFSLVIHASPLAEVAIGMQMALYTMDSGCLDECTGRVCSYIRLAIGRCSVLLTLSVSLHFACRYDGEFVADMKDGFGILVYANGERYEGQWKGNFAHGTGTLTYVDGDKYIGEWSEGKKHGHGELFYINGDKFRGMWVSDKANGLGRLEYANGDIYEGEWRNDQREGTSNLLL